MNFTIAISALASGLFASTTALASWSPTVRVNEINVGNNGVQGAYVSLIGHAYTGCTVTTTALLDGANDVNYKDMLAILLSAKLADRYVKIAYSGCSSGYSVIREVVLQ